MNCLRILKKCLPLLVALLPSGAFAQTAYPQDYFRNPLAIPILLAGNFGECRPGHFHSGIDIKTGGKENLPVYAAADGYVSRIKMEPGGFGHGLYITHPDGYTTLYAHLNDFVPAIQQYVRQQQYAKESWTVDLTLSPDQFPVKKGQQIAWSGNTGASTAPHLHFEIRDTKTEHPLNPQLFGFDIRDTRPPVPLRLALYDRSRSIYEQSPKLLPLKQWGETWAIAGDTVIMPQGLTGLGLAVNDYMDGSDNTLAFYTAEWYVDESPQGSIRLDDIGYDETRYLHAYADYKIHELDGSWVQLLFRLPGNLLERIYANLNGGLGTIALPDELPHPVRIVLTDAAGNTSEIRFFLRQQGSPLPSGCPAPMQPGKVNPFTGPNLLLTLGPAALYDSVCFRFRNTHDAASLSDRYLLHGPEVPLHQSAELLIRPDKPVPFRLRDKLALVYRDGNKESGRAATMGDQGWYKASIRNFGEYRLVADTVSPRIRAQSAVKGNLAKVKRIAFTVTDEITSVKSFRGELDGKWILFEMRGSTWFYTMDNHCPPGSHTLVVRAMDENGNETVQRFTFVR